MFDDVIRILKDNIDFADIGQPQTNASILQAEEELGVTFPRSYCDYLRIWGWISFGPNEYFGLGSEINDVVDRTKRARKSVKLDDNLIMVCDQDGDEYVCIDTDVGSGKDSRVIIWDVSNKIISRIRSSNFEEFLRSDLQDFLD